MLHFITFIMFLLNFSILRPNQPAEHGLFLGSYAQKELRLEHKRRINASLLNEKKVNGTASNVFYIRNISDFLFLATKKNLPLVINIYNKNNLYKENMHVLADKLKDKVLFLSVDISNNKPTFDLLKLFIGSESNIEFKVPSVLFCHSKSMLLDRGLVHFKKGSFIMLSTSSDLNLNDIYNKIIYILTQTIELVSG